MGDLIRRKARGVDMRDVLPMNLSDVWHAALELKRQFHAEAVAVAATRADQCFGRGDLDGFRSWRRITHAIVELDRAPPPRERH